MIMNITYNNKEMQFAPINVDLDELIPEINGGNPAVVILEPGDATRYVLLLVPLSIGIAPHLRGFGIPSAEASNYIFVSKLSGEDCQGTWIPFGQKVVVGTWHVDSLSGNSWSQEFLAWWFTELYKLL